MSKVLIIEDDAPFSLLLKIALTHAGHLVATAASGTEGVRKLQQAHFDVVITDIVMPGMDGNDVADFIHHSAHRSPAVIGMTATLDLASRHKFDMVLEKPFAIKPFLNTVAAYATPGNLTATAGRA
jgi:CheY-like chemotaxis protein